MDTQINWQELIVIGTGITGMVSGIGALIYQFRKAHSDERLASFDDNREDMKSIVDAARVLLEPLEQRVRALELENRELRLRVETMKVERQQIENQVRLFSGGVRILVHQLMENGINPRWSPPSDLANTEMGPE